MLSVFKENPSVLNIYIYGSRVYGTYTEKSDYDYIVVVDTQENAQKLEPCARGENEDFTIYTKEQFEEQVANHEISALECLFLSQENIIKKTVEFPFTLDLEKLRPAISQKSSNSWVKAKKKFIVDKDYAPYIGQKSAWHSLRILDFGCQLARYGKITNYKETNALLPVILKLSSWEGIDDALRSTNRAKNTEFKKLAPKTIPSPSPSPLKP